ncbi:adenylate isopentenyltransferase 3, chloroplastic [Ricinus communis]|nr:adenylate isopentenyltransferase 3, chloroplastic [Ricinus communis]|eukprot:XP_002533064.2 adenylate isopentenyltransferase 3, chloroplastic [Ricinus communis]
MRLSMSFCQQTHHHQNTLDVPTGRLKMDIVTPRWQKPKVVIVMGATGTGKSKLSLDLATQCPAEIINSDKMQLYKGLDITTNKITEEEMSGIPHHLLGVVNPNVDFTAKDFCNMASQAIGSISTRGLLPIVVGGSNSYIEALVDDPDYRFRSKYDCCFLWVDVPMHALQEFLLKRVDQMVKKGMIEEVRNIFDPRADYSKGIRKSIGVPEFDKYLKAEAFSDERNCARLLQQAISEVKHNNCKLARRQLEKIHRLKYVKGWNIHRIDATEVFRKRGKKADDAWKKLVARPSIDIVRQFLYSANTAAKVPATAGTTKDYFAECLVS